MFKKLSFSLVELLVVISLLMVLTSLLVSSLNKTFEMSASVQCASNLKQQGQGVHLYTDDANGVLPSMNFYQVLSTGEVDFRNNRHVAWKFQTGNYVYGNSDVDYIRDSQRKSGGIEMSKATLIHNDLITGVYECPLATEFVSLTGDVYDQIDRSRRGGYGWNYRLQDGEKLDLDRAGIYDLGVQESGVTKPALTLMIGDTLNEDVSFTFPQILYHPGRMDGKLYSVHQGGINALFTDLHVQNMLDYEVRNYSINDDEFLFQYVK